MPEDWYLAHNIDKSWKQESSLTKWIWLATRLLHLWCFLDFLTLVLFICLCTNSSDISLNSRFIGTGTFFIFVNFNDTGMIFICNSFISNIFCHIYKEIIKTFCYHVLIIYDFIFFTEYSIFSKMATFVGNKRLDSRPKILWFGTT